jgi:hypothetical protein
VSKEQTCIVHPEYVSADLPCILENRLAQLLAQLVSAQFVAQALWVAIERGDPNGDMPFDQAIKFNAFALSQLGWVLCRFFGGGRKIDGVTCGCDGSSSVVSG